MDLITSRTMEISHLGMNGLMDRQQAISSNIANVMTPDYQRKEVAFESQLSEIIEKEKKVISLSTHYILLFECNYDVHSKIIIAIKYKNK